MLVKSAKEIQELDMVEDFLEAVLPGATKAQSMRVRKQFEAAVAAAQAPAKGGKKAKPAKGTPEYEIESLKKIAKFKNLDHTCRWLFPCVFVFICFFCAAASGGSSNSAASSDMLLLTVKFRSFLFSTCVLARLLQLLPRRSCEDDADRGCY